MQLIEEQFGRLYAAFNARDLETLRAAMAPDVDWANGMTGGRVHGWAAVQAYWTEQWETLDPRVEPVRVSTDAAGQVVVDVHQVVRDRAGVVLVDQMVRHTYWLRDGLVERMEIHASDE
jgi:hypothetical protein